MRRIPFIALLLLLGACETLDFSDTAARMERDQCLAEADAYPGAVEDCEKIGRAAEY